MSISTKIIGGLGIAGAAAALAVVVPGTASAQGAVCQTPFGAPAVNVTVPGSTCQSTSGPTGAAAAYGLGGNATANAGVNALALAIAQIGSIATSNGTGGAAPAAIALGPGANASASSTVPGLSIAIAAPGATVSIDSTKGAVCNGIGFAGNLVTGAYCLRLS